MRKKGLLVFVLGILFLSSVCQIKDQYLLENGKIPEDLIITLNRTACYGTCPIYELTVKANETVLFNGIEFTKTKGEAEGKITQEQLKQLITEFKKADFFKLQDRYVEAEDGCTEVKGTDDPSERISIQINGQSKQVSHDFGCRGVAGNPTELIANLGKKIDEMTNSKQWITESAIKS